MEPSLPNRPQFVKNPGSRSSKAIWIVLGTCLLLFAAAVVFVGFFFMSNEPGGSFASSPTSWTTEDIALAGDLPSGSTLRERYRDDRGIDALLVAKFSTTDAEAIRFATDTTGTAPGPGFSIQDLDSPTWWKNRPATGRGSSATTTVARRVLLSDPDPNGITTVWVMANQM